MPVGTHLLKGGLRSEHQAMQSKCLSKAQADQGSGKAPRLQQGQPLLPHLFHVLLLRFSLLVHGLLAPLAWSLSGQLIVLQQKERALLVLVLTTDGQLLMPQAQLPTLSTFSSASSTKGKICCKRC